MPLCDRRDEISDWEDLWEDLYESVLSLEDISGVEVAKNIEIILNFAVLDLISSFLICFQ